MLCVSPCLFSFSFFPLLYYILLLYFFFSAHCLNYLLSLEAFIQLKTLSCLFFSFFPPRHPPFFIFLLSLALKCHSPCHFTPVDLYLEPSHSAIVTAQRACVRICVCVWVLLAAIVVQFFFGIFFVKPWGPVIKLPVRKKAFSLLLCSTWSLRACSYVFVPAYVFGSVVVVVNAVIIHSL